jgi:hypothetical protein
MEQPRQPDATGHERSRRGEEPDGTPPVGDGEDVPEAPAAGVLFPDLDDPPEPNEPG